MHIAIMLTLCYNNDKEKGGIMKEIFGNKNLDGCIRVILQGNAKAYNQIVDFLSSIPSNVMKTIKASMEVLDKQEKTAEPKKYSFYCNKCKWEFSYGDGNFGLARQSATNSNDKISLDIFDFNEALYNIIDCKLDDGMEIIGVFRDEKMKKAFGHNYGLDYSFWVERSLILKKLIVKTEIEKLKDGYSVDFAFGKMDIEKTNNLNLAKCWSKTDIQAALEQYKADLAEDEREEYEFLHGKPEDKKSDLEM